MEAIDGQLYQDDKESIDSVAPSLWQALHESPRALTAASTLTPRRTF
jgi:hypothetical protein